MTTGLTSGGACSVATVEDFGTPMNDPVLAAALTRDMPDYGSVLIAALVT